MASITSNTESWNGHSFSEVETHIKSRLDNCSEKINYITTSGSAINPSNGLNVLAKLSSSSSSLYLPTLSQSQTFAGVSGSQRFAYVLRICAHTASKAFTLYGYRNSSYSQYPHVRAGSAADRTTGVTEGNGDTDTYLITYDGSLYEAYRLCYTE